MKLRMKKGKKFRLKLPKAKAKGSMSTPVYKISGGASG